MNDAIAAALIGTAGVMVGAGLSWFQASQSANREDKRTRDAAHHEDRRRREERLHERKVEVYGGLLGWLANVDDDLRDLWASFNKWAWHGGLDVKQAEYRTTSPPDEWVYAPRLDGTLRAQLEVFAPAHIVKLALSLDWVAIRTADETLSMGRAAISAVRDPHVSSGAEPVGSPNLDELFHADRTIGGYYKKWRIRHAALLNSVRYDMNNRDVLPVDRAYLNWDAFPADDLSDIPATELPDEVRAAISEPEPEEAPAKGAGSTGDGNAKEHDPAEQGY